MSTEVLDIFLINNRVKHIPFEMISYDLHEYIIRSALIMTFRKEEEEEAKTIQLTYRIKCVSVYNTTVQEYQ